MFVKISFVKKKSWSKKGKKGKRTTTKKKPDKQKIICPIPKEKNKKKTNPQKEKGKWKKKTMISRLGVCQRPVLVFWGRGQLDWLSDLS